MRKVKTIAARITVDFLLSALAVLATIVLYRALTWRAYCEGHEIGSNYPSYPTREAAIRAVPAYRNHHPSCPTASGK